MDTLKGYIIVILSAVYLSPVSSDYDRSTDTSTIVQSLAIVGGRGLLPCNVSLPGSDHPPTLIIWYKNEGGDPVYSYDLRGTRSENSRHWSDDHVLGSRANFKIQFTNSRRRRPEVNSRVESTIPPKKYIGKSFLLLRNVLRQDQGIYRCRVDFHSAPTRNSRVNLTVIVPPSNPVIVNESGREVTQFLGPYTEGSSVRVSCELTGGRPKPSIFWSENGKFLPADSEVSSGSIVTSTVLLHSLQRSSNGNIIACSASNNNISLPTKASIKLLMNLAPTAVWIHKKETHLSAEKETFFQCSSRGSSPRTAFTWLIGERVLEMEIKINNFTSVLQYTPKVEDHDQTLICRSENPDLEKSAIQDTLGLLVHYKPIVKLKYGSNLNTSNMRVGDDVYFECHVSSRPTHTRISWYHNKTKSESVTDTINKSISYSLYLRLRFRPQ
nr:synaptogenesis protein syg-2-like [Lepeophtheirus salmonis]